MKLKTFVIPILSLSCLIACSNNVPKESSKLFENQAYYCLSDYNGYGPSFDKFEKEKYSHYVFKDNCVYEWSYHSDADSYYVSLRGPYIIRGDVLFWDVQSSSYEETNVKYGDNTIYDKLDKSRINRNGATYEVFGNLDYGMILGQGKTLYATFDVAKDLGYTK